MQFCECDRPTPFKHRMPILETDRLREQRHYSMIKLDMIQIVEF